MDEELISKSLDQVRRQRMEAERERAAADRAIAAAREEERLLLRLLALRKGEFDEVPASVETASSPGEVTTKSRTNEVKYPAVDAVVEELAGAGRAVHISDLMRVLGEKRIPIPGAGTQANLIAHLRRDGRLVRPSRGMYALAAWGLENMPSQAKRRRRRRRIARASASSRKTQS